MNEAVCERCGGRNLSSWHAPSPLWNAVMREGPAYEERWSIICPQCFAELAALEGIVAHVVWHLDAEHGLAVALPTHDPDGRVWDAARCLWVDP